MTDPLIAAVLARTMYDDVQRELSHPHRREALRQQEHRRLQRRAARRRRLERLVRGLPRVRRVARAGRPALG